MVFFNETRTIDILQIVRYQLRWALWCNQGSLQRSRTFRMVSQLHSGQFCEMSLFHAKISILASLPGRVNHIQCGWNPIRGVTDSP